MISLLLILAGDVVIQDGFCESPVSGGTAQWSCAFIPDQPPTTQCNDGIDNDGDTYVDLADPGCTSESDDDEFNAPPIVYACEDGVDNDGDGLVDLADPGCTSATDDDEFNAPDPDPNPQAPLSFIDVTSKVQGQCISGNPFGFLMADWDGDYLFTFSHGRSQHCAWEYDGQNFNLNQTLSDNLSDDFVFGWAVVGVDIDGNGAPDLIGNATEGKRGIQYNINGDPVFYGGADWQGYEWNRRLATLIDYEADGDLDLYENGKVWDIASNTQIASYSGYHVFDRDNDGAVETFDLPIACDAQRLIFHLDFENDGDTDVVCANPDGNQIYAARNDGGSFVAINNGMTYSGSNGVTSKASHAVGDINNDGFNDIVIGGQDIKGYVYLSNGDTTFTQLRLDSDLLGINVNGGCGYSCRPTVSLYDFDNDCDLDLVTHRFNNASNPNINATLFENQSGGSCLKVPVRSGDRVIVRDLQGNIVFSEERIATNMSMRVVGSVHVGLGDLSAEEVTIEIN